MHLKILNFVLQLQRHWHAQHPSLMKKTVMMTKMRTLMTWNLVNQILRRSTKHHKRTIISQVPLLKRKLKEE